MDLVLRGLVYAKMKAAHPKVLIQPSQLWEGKGFEVNRATILGLRSTASDQAATSKVLSFIGLAPISMSFLGSSTGL